MQYDILMRLNEIYRHGVYAEETLSEEEMLSIEEWVEALIEEGYDLDDYSDEELYEAYLETLSEAKADEGLTPLQKIRKRNKEGNLVMPVGDQTSERRSYHKAGRGEKKERGDKYDVESTVGKDKWAREAEVKKRYGSHYDETGRRERNIRAIKSQKKVGGPKGLPEELDLYDIVSEYLVSEGFCDSYEDADVIMVNMSEEWRESIMEEVLDEAVRGSQRSIANRITGSDIRKVTRGNKDVYKKPEWEDKIQNKTRREFASLRQKPENIINNRTERERQKANAKSINRLNAKPNLGNASDDDMYHIRPEDKTSYYREIPTDYRARRRRASGR